MLKLFDGGVKLVQKLLIRTLQFLKDENLPTKKGEMKWPGNSYLAMHDGNGVRYIPLTQESTGDTTRFLRADNSWERPNSFVQRTTGTGAPDWSVTDLDVGSWYDLDCGDIVPNSACAIVFSICVQNTSVSEWFALRKNGHVTYTPATGSVLVADVQHNFQYVCPCDSEQLVEYFLSSGGAWDQLDITIVGWLI